MNVPASLRHHASHLVRFLAGLALVWLAADSVAAADDKSMTPLTQSETAPPAKSFWDQDYMLGDWGGERSKLESEGVKFDFNDIGDLLSDVSGSQEHHVAYFGRFRAALDLDLNKLVGVDSEFFVTGIYQYGRNLSADYLHTNTLTSSIAGPESLRLDQAWYKQWLINHMMSITVGQIATVNEFGATDFFDILFNDELGYAPNALFSTRQPFSPAGKPGAVVWGDLSDITKGLYVKIGAFTDAPSPYHPDYNGVDLNDDFTHGIAAAAEVGYKEQDTVYDGTYKIGVNGDSGFYVNPDSGQVYHGNYNIYGIAEKTVYHPVRSDGKVDIQKGLDLLFEFVGEPGDRNALQYEFTMGGRYTGLIPGRDADKVGFGLIYSDNGEAFSQASQAAGGPGLGGELTLELDYQYNPAPWLSIQPDLQYIIDPSGIQGRDDILVAGLRTIVRF
jgi:porin